MIFMYNNAVLKEMLGTRITVTWLIKINFNVFKRRHGLLHICFGLRSAAQEANKRDLENFTYQCQNRKYVNQHNVATVKPLFVRA